MVKNEVYYTHTMPFCLILTVEQHDRYSIQSVSGIAMIGIKGDMSARRTALDDISTAAMRQSWRDMTSESLTTHRPTVNVTGTTTASIHVVSMLQWDSAIEYSRHFGCK